MEKLSISNIIFGCLLILLIIPKTRTFIQVNVQKLLSRVNSASVISIEDQKVITEYTGQLKAINGDQDIDFNDLKKKTRDDEHALIIGQK